MLINKNSISLLDCLLSCCSSSFKFLIKYTLCLVSVSYYYICYRTKNQYLLAAWPLCRLQSIVSHYLYDYNMVVCFIIKCKKTGFFKICSVTPTKKVNNSEAWTRTLYANPAFFGNPDTLASWRVGQQMVGAGNWIDTYVENGLDSVWIR